MIDPKVAQAIAAGKVPAGVSAEFLSESKDRPAIIAIILVTVITSVIVLLRLISRLLVVKRFGIDDGLALCSWVRSCYTHEAFDFFGCANVVYAVLFYLIYCHGNHFDTTWLWPSL